jgi:competence protein ComEA
VDPSPSPSASSPPPPPASLAECWAGWRDRLLQSRRPAIVVAALAAVAVVGLLAVLLARPAQGPPPRLTLPVAAADAGPAGATSPSTNTPPSASATVHAAGAVASPGVYAVPAGARVADVVAAAGGPLPEADLDRINLATRVNDGDRVHLPRKGEAASVVAETGSTPTSTTPAGPIDLNTATLDQLDGLPGIGPATAQAILTYRSRHGRFRSVNEDRKSTRLNSSHNR